MSRKKSQKKAQKKLSSRLAAKFVTLKGRRSSFCHANMLPSVVLVSFQSTTNVRFAEQQLRKNILYFIHNYAVITNKEFSQQDVNNLFFSERLLQIVIVNSIEF